MAKKQKYYVVWQGAQPGVYDNWNECKAQIAGYPNARYKSFERLEEAVQAFRGNPSDYMQKKAKGAKKFVTSASRKNIIWQSLSVDAACSGNPGLMEYQGVHTQTKDEVFRMGPFRQGTNNVGEFLALVHGLAYLQKIGQPDLPIYTDSKTAMSWVRHKKVKTSLKKSAANAQLFDLMERGEIWLKNNTYKNPILKWNTVEWGEIPADFGRK